MLRWITYTVDDKKHWHIRWVSFKRRMGRYALKDEPVLDAQYHHGEPAWQGWIVAILSIITALNTTDLAITGLSGAMTIPFFLNFAFVTLNVLVALYIIKNTIIRLIYHPEYRLRTIFKLITQGGACYGLVIGAMATLAATTPAASTVLIAVFVANAVAIGINLTHTLIDTFLPYIQRKCYSFLLKYWDQKPDPISLSVHEENLMKQNDEAYRQQCTSKAIYQTLQTKQALLTKNDLSNDDKNRIRRRFAVYFKHEKQRHERKWFGTIMSRAPQIKRCCDNMKQTIKTGKIHEDTDPYEHYMSGLNRWLNHLAYEISVIAKIKIRHQQAVDTGSTQDAFMMLKKIAQGDESTSVTIDGLDQAVALFNAYGVDHKAENIALVLTQCVNFDRATLLKMKQSAGPLKDALDAIYCIAKTTVEAKFRKKLKKLHDACGLTYTEIQEALKYRLAQIGIKDTDDLVEDAMTILKTELNKRKHPCPHSSHDCESKLDATTTSI